ncbi:MAG: ATP-binding protein [Planctomycetes bacterium]|nr:ATP-binding protein [Planctomycetota bacterium]
MREATAESDAEEVEAVATLRAAETFDPPPAMLILGKRFGLSSYEQQVLLLCAAMELDTRIPALCANAQDDPGRPYPTFALTMALFDEPTWDAHLPDRPLRYWRLIEINQPGAQPLTASPLRADERVVNYLKGLNTLDDRLTPLMEPLNIEADGVDLPPSQQTTIEAVIRNIEAPAAHSPVVALLGSDGPSKQLVASRAAARFGLSLYRLPAELLPAQTAELEELARLWGRESILLPVALYLDAQEVDEASKNGDSGHAAALRRFLARTAGLLFLDIRELWPRLGREVVPIDVSKPMPGEQREAWEDILGPGADGSPYQLAGQFDMNLPMIQKIARTALSEVSENGGVIQSRLWEACLVGTRPRLDVLARRIDPLATWDDIVLPKEEMGLLHQIADQVGQRSRVYEDWGYRRKMNRGLGISALFAGESGTGKTMAAEVIANDLHLNLYLIDLSAVVSKYIGETEKNLRRLFDAAEEGGAILFFDEADALFGKRSEVKDSHDRYANIEINYLLQRMEAYRGLAILATNMKSALDQAFMRRLRFIVNFPFPIADDRRRIWMRVFPSETPTEGLDYERLVRLNLTGGSILNISLNAAFLAARAGEQVSMRLVLEAARSEFRKLERPINEADFRWTESAVSGQQ